MSQSSTNIQIHRRFKWLVLLFIIECMGALGWILSTPTDQKNAFFLGYSISRWIMILVIMIITAALSVVFFKYFGVYKFFERKISDRSESALVKAATGISAVLLWIFIWISPDLAPEFNYEIERLKPLLVLVIGLFFETIVFFQLNPQHFLIPDLLNDIRKNQKTIRNIGILFMIPALLFIVLKVFSPIPGEKSLSYPPGPTISPLQLLFGIILFLIVYFIKPNQEITSSKKSKWQPALWILIWGCVFLLWMSTPFTCADDRPGPYLPNNICYPQVDDSVFSIGSHYITLGRGIFNHWFTDKPFYMLFLAIGQWIAGPQIDRYLTFQIAVFAIIPVFLFILGKKYLNSAGGFFLAFLSAMMGMNNIKLYSIVGGVNAKLENSEILTSLWLIIFSFALVKFLINPEKYKWIIFSGGILGLATLTRINPVFVLPIIVVFLIIKFWKHWKKSITSIIILSIGFLIVFIPWLVIAKDSQGQNYYLRKIEDVINNRYSKNNAYLVSPIGKTTAKMQPSTISAPQTTAGKAWSSKGTTLWVFTIDELESNPIIANQTQGGKLGFFYHFLNNEYMSLARLPVDFSIDQLPTLLKQTLWTDSHRLYFWKLDLSFENILVLLINLFIVISGIYYMARRWGIAGMVPLVVQLAYHLANGFALTSGERYLEPVEWVTLLYFVAGFYFICNLVFSKSVNNLIMGTSSDTLNNNDSFFSVFKKRENLIVLVCLLIIGFLLPATFLIPDQFNNIQQSKINEQVSDALVKQKYAVDGEFDLFAKNPNAVIVEGFAYHPRIYISPIVFKDQEIFELTVLTKDNVYISNFQKFKSLDPFIDEKQIILFGCKIKEKDFWGAESVIMRTLGFIDLDNDNKVYMNKWVKLDCQ